MPANANEPPTDVAEIAARVEAYQRAEAAYEARRQQGGQYYWSNEAFEYEAHAHELADDVPTLLALVADWRTRALAAEAALKPFAEIWDDWLGADDLDHSGTELYDEFSLFMRQWLIDGDERYVEAHKRAYDLLAVRGGGTDENI